jgi:type I restriction enzyme M protein
MPSFGKRIPLTREHFSEFEVCYQSSQRMDAGEEGRWRYFSREEIGKRNDNLDISWLRDESLADSDSLPAPEEIASEIMDRLSIATDNLDGLMQFLSE